MIRREGAKEYGAFGKDMYVDMGMKMIRMINPMELTDAADERPSLDMTLRAYCFCC